MAGYQIKWFPWAGPVADDDVCLGEAGRRIWGKQVDLVLMFALYFVLVHTTRGKVTDVVHEGLKIVLERRTYCNLCMTPLILPVQYTSKNQPPLITKHKIELLPSSFSRVLFSIQ